MNSTKVDVHDPTRLDGMGDIISSSILDRVWECLDEELLGVILLGPEE